MKYACVSIVSKEYEKIYQVHLDSLKKYLPNCDYIRYYPEEFSSIYKDIIQHICASRPEAVLSTFQKGYDFVIFLGADVIFYDVPGDLLTKDHNVIATPHLTEPLPDDGKMPSNESVSKTGHINSDLIVWKNTSEVTQFLEWQKDIMKDKCVDTGSIFLDQTWLNFLPFFVDDVYIERDPGYNQAYWNFKHREDIPPICFQFSGFDPDYPERISKYQNRYIAQGKFLKFLEDYAEKIK